MSVRDGQIGTPAAVAPAFSPQHRGDRVVPIAQLDLSFRPRSWPFADAYRAEIDRYFEEAQRKNPSLWNGRVLLMHDHALIGDTLHGSYLETDFASFLAWRDWRFPDRQMHNCFALGAIRAADGAFLVGVMGSHTANAGRIYFPGGTPEPADLAGDKVDLLSSVLREVHEETGLSPADMEVAPGWTAIFAGARIALLKTLRVRLSAEQLCERIRAYFATQEHSELADIRVVRTFADCDRMMPDFMLGFFTDFYRERGG